MTGLLLIASAAYVEQELAIEFGQLPPAFLPIGVSPLYEAQISQFSKRNPIYLTIPESFQPQPCDSRRLKEAGVTVVPVPEGLSLGNSIIYALNYIDSPNESVEILHGDTLINAPPPKSTDCIAIHDKGDDYSWAAIDLVDGNPTGFEVIKAGEERRSDRPVVCGYFAFSSSRLLVRSITRAKGDFITGLDLYNRERPLMAFRADTWMDFGHIQTYFRSRRTINTARSFNTLRSDPLTVRKSSSDIFKINAEASWLNNVPSAVKPYCVRIFNHGSTEKESFYYTEYQNSPTLSELLVFSAIGRSTWRSILASCYSFLSACESSHGTQTSEVTLADLTVEKTNARLDHYAKASLFSISSANILAGRPLPSLTQIAENVGKMIDLRTKVAETIMHGDFCFSNILYNSRAARISVIDPRGYTEAGRATIYGDLRYDLAKFSHSVTGCYDYILAGRYKLIRQSQHQFEIEYETSAHHLWLEQSLSDLKIRDVTPNDPEIKALTISLFLAMLPLHADRPDRQAAFIATALRLYSQIDGV